MKESRDGGAGRVQHKKEQKKNGAGGVVCKERNKKKSPLTAATKRGKGSGNRTYSLGRGRRIKRRAGLASHVKEELGEETQTHSLESNREGKGSFPRPDGKSFNFSPEWYQVVKGYCESKRCSTEFRQRGRKQKQVCFFKKFKKPPPRSGRRERGLEVRCAHILFLTKTTKKPGFRLD